MYVRGEMNASYEKLKSLSDAVYAGRRTKWAKDAIKILNTFGIKLRQKDGKLIQVNFSIPESLPGSFVLGLRYKKQDRSQTEDHFLFQDGQPIERYYKGDLENKLREYIGTHRKQIKL